MTENNLSAIKDAIASYCKDRNWRLFGTPSQHDGEWRALVSMEAAGPLLLVAFKTVPQA